MNDETVKPHVPLFTECDEPEDYERYIHGDEEVDSLGKALKRYVKETGLSRKQIEILTGISKTSFYYYYKDKKRISYEYLIMLCVALRLHPLRQEYLFSFIPAVIKESDARYYELRSFLANCAFIEECTLDALNVKLRAKGKEPLIPKKRDKHNG